MKLYLATHNAHKVAEFSQILSGFEIVADDPSGVEENAPDFAGNALLKARAIAARHPGEWCVADDSGLEVAALGGAPGVRSARYAGRDGDTPANNALLLENLAGVEDRRANFTCAIALIDPQGREAVVEGKCFGTIAKAPSAGANGFGYDPLFLPDGAGGKSFAELAPEAKNAISHRGRALAKAKEVICARERRGRGGVLLPWLKFFRAVNLPTVPGDVLAGAVAAQCAGIAAPGSGSQMAAAAFASVFFYMHGLADNDIAGATTDSGRPIPDGEISLRSARVARSLCFLAALALAPLFALPPAWFWAAAALLAASLVYNRAKTPILMGLCRALNIVCGFCAVTSRFPVAEQFDLHRMIPLFSIVAIWLFWFTGVTRFSAGEENDPAKKRLVGVMIGAIVWIQILALTILAMLHPEASLAKPALVAAGCCLVALRLFKRLMPGVSAS